MKNILLNWVLALHFILIVLLVSCDKITEDLDPAPPENEETEVTTATNEPVIVDLIENHQVTAATTFELEGTPAHGKAEFVSNGLLMYTPNENTTASEDLVNYKVCKNGECKKFRIKIIIIIIINPTDSSLIRPCRQGAFTDFAKLECKDSVLIDVLRNDKFCNNPVDPKTLKIVKQPFMGTATVIPTTSAANHPLVKYKFAPNALLISPLDVFIYSVAELNNPNKVAYAAVIVDVTRNRIRCLCELKLVDDVAFVKENSIRNMIDILANDKFCPDFTDWTEFKIIEKPLNGTAELGNDRKAYYTPKQGFVGRDRFIYQLRHKNGDIQKAEVKIEIGDQVCPTVLIQANDDEYKFPSAQTPAGTAGFVLDVLKNDLFCPQTLDKFMIIQGPDPAHGTVRIEGNKVIYLPPSNTFIGTVSFTYKICDTNGHCDTATVKIIIGDSACIAVMIQANDDEFMYPISQFPAGTIGVFLNVLANDIFCEHTFDKIFITQSIGTMDGTLKIVDGKIYYLPPNNTFAGTITFIYKICDKNGNCDTATVKVKITN